MTTPFACGGLYARGARRSSQPIFRGTHMPKEFLLVHGACHGAWCWEEVTDRLRARGHRVAALDMPGHGRRAAEVRRASVASYAAAVAEALAAEGMSRAVVVGHSMGGLVIPKAAELAPARIRHLVFLAAVVVPHGGSLVRTMMTPQALRPLVEPIDMRAFHALGVPRTYIRCLGDRAVLPMIAAQFAARLGVTPVDMDSAHDPMLSRPEELCRILERVDP